MTSPSPWACCGQIPAPGVGCTQTHYDDFTDGTRRERLRYPYGKDKAPACRDCWAPSGGLCHPGCHNEICAKCGFQAISCGCYMDEDED